MVVLGAHRRHWICVCFANVCVCSLGMCVCACTGSRLVLLLPWGLRAHFLLCIVISFPVRSSQHHYISDKLHCKFSRPLAQRSIWDWFRMPCWAELEDQFEMDCSRQGANDTQCSAHLLSLLCFLHPSLSLTVISFSPWHYSLLSPPLFQLFHTCPLRCCYSVLPSVPFNLLHQFLLMPTLPPPPTTPPPFLPPSLQSFSSQHQVGSRDRVDFISRGSQAL